MRAITITMSVQDETAAGLGFIVDHIKYGSSGQFFSGEGPKGKEYSFGYRKQHQTGIQIHCGKMVLNENTHLILIAEKGHCEARVVRD